VIGQDQALAALRRVGATVEVDMDGLRVSVPARYYDLLEPALTASPVVFAVALGIWGYVRGAGTPSLLVGVFAVLLAGWLVAGLAQRWLEGRSWVEVALTDRTIRCGDQEMPLEELFGVFTASGSLQLERRGDRTVVVEISTIKAAHEPLQALLYAHARRRQEIARSEGHDTIKNPSQPPEALSALRER